MRLLILGGSQFLGRAIAAHACAAGHNVTCAARGIAGPIASGARFVRVDRDVSHGLAPLLREEFDATITRRGSGRTQRRCGHPPHRGSSTAVMKKSMVPPKSHASRR